MPVTCEEEADVIVCQGEGCPFPERLAMAQAGCHLCLIVRADGTTTEFRRKAQ